MKRKFKSDSCKNKKTKIKTKKFTRAYVLMNEKKEILVRTRSSKGC